MSTVVEEQISGWAEFEQWCREGAEEKYLFRGQVDPRFQLQPSLWRYFSANAVDPDLDHVGRTLASLLHHFHEHMKRGMRRELWEEDRLFERAHKLSEEARARHCGLPTLLLDWSRSPYVAAFFAYDGQGFQPKLPQDDVAIWVLDERALNDYQRELSASAEPVDKVKSDIERERLPGYVVLPSDRVMYTERLYRQLGYFTRAYAVHPDLVAFLEQSEIEVDRPVLRKLRLPSRDQKLVLQALELMTITPAALMGDADGAAAAAVNEVLRFGQWGA